VAPERAIAELQGKNFVWLIGADNKATQQPVKIVDSTVPGSVIVVEGLKGGDKIVVEGLQKVRQGLVVKPMTSAELAAANQTADATTTAPQKKD